MQTLRTITKRHWRLNKGGEGIGNPTKIRKLESATLQAIGDLSQNLPFEATAFFELPFSFFLSWRVLREEDHSKRVESRSVKQKNYRRMAKELFKWVDYRLIYEVSKPVGMSLQILIDYPLKEANVSSLKLNHNQEWDEDAIKDIFNTIDVQSS
nr:hypothetical protein Iba_chr08cCG14790 [Ipomoea batatas]